MATPNHSAPAAADSAPAAAGSAPAAQSAPAAAGSASPDQSAPVAAGSASPDQTAPVAAGSASPDQTRWLKRQAVLAGIVLLLVVIALFFFRTPWSVTGAAAGAAICLLLKEVLATFARDSGWGEDRRKKLENGAAIASLFAAVLGAPAVLGAIFILPGLR